MKQIVYLVDSLSPLALKSFSEKFYGENILKKNYIDKLASKSIILKNIYGHGETYSTTYNAFTNKNIYKNFADSWDISKSFLEKSDLGKFFKKRNFTNIYYRNCSTNNQLTGFYKRYLESLTFNFDYFCFKKKKKNYSLKKFFQEEGLIFKFQKNQNIFIIIHDYTLHDSKSSYNGNVKNILNTIKNKVSNNVRTNLNLINYNPKKDNLILFSDHGLTRNPVSKLFASNEKVSKIMYDKLYKEIFLDEKLKMLCFIKPANFNNKIVLDDYYKPSIINNVIKSLFLLKKKKLKNFIDKIKKTGKKEIYTSIRSVNNSIYQNKILKRILHGHILKISQNKKIIYSHSHPDKFSIQKNNVADTIPIKVVDQKFNSFIKSYYSFNNILKKIFYFNFYILHLLKKKLIQKIG